MRRRSFASEGIFGEAEPEGCASIRASGPYHHQGEAHYLARRKSADETQSDAPERKSASAANESGARPS